MIRGLVVGLCIAAAACGEGGPFDLVVDLRTDFRSGVDFQRVHAEVRDGAGVERYSADLRAGVGEDFLAGQRLLHAEALAEGRYVVVVELERTDGTVVVGDTVRVDLRSDTGVTVMLTTSCLGVTCPELGDPADATQCVNGLCAPEGCDVGAGTCPPLACASDADCVTTVMCAVGRCREGRCVAEPSDALCDTGETCSPVDGCVRPPPPPCVPFVLPAIPAVRSPVRVLLGPPASRVVDIDPFGRSASGVRVGAGAIDDTPGDDLVVGAGPDGEPRVRLFSGGGASGVSGTPPVVVYDPAFTGGLYVGAADLDGEGRDAFLTGAGLGGGAHVRVFSAEASLLESFPYPDFYGGVRVAAGDTDGDGIDEILVAPGPPGVDPIPPVQLYDTRTGGVRRSFVITDEAQVALGDVNGDGSDDVILAHAGRVIAYTAGTGVGIGAVTPYGDAYTGEISVAAGDVDCDGDDDLITGALQAGAHVKAFDVRSGTVLFEDLTADTGYLGGIFVAVGDFDASGSVDIAVGAAEGNP